MIYLDNAATTKPCDEAKAAVMKGLEVFGNPSSLHRAGLDAELLVSDAREIIADALGVTLMRSISLPVLLKATIPLFSGLTRLTENVKSALSYPLLNTLL